MSGTPEKRHTVRVLAAAGISTRRACSLVGTSRSHLACEAKAKDDAELLAAITEIRRRKPRWGVRRTHRQLRRRGLAVNRKRIERIWRETSCSPSIRSRARRLPWPATLREQLPRHPVRKPCPPQRSHRRVAESQRRLHEIEVGTIQQLPLQHEGEVVQGAEQGTAVGLGDHGLARGFNLALCSGHLDAETEKHAREGLGEVPGKVLHVAGSHDHRQARVLADQEDKTLVTDCHWPRVPVAENCRCRLRHRAGRADASEQLLRAADGHHRDRGYQRRGLHREEDDPSTPGPRQTTEPQGLGTCPANLSDAEKCCSGARRRHPSADAARGAPLGAGTSERRSARASGSATEGALTVALVMPSVARGALRWHRGRRRTALPQGHAVEEVLHGLVIDPGGLPAFKDLIAPQQTPAHLTLLRPSSQGRGLERLPATLRQPLPVRDQRRDTTLGISHQAVVAAPHEGDLIAAAMPCSEAKRDDLARGVAPCRVPHPSRRVAPGLLRQYSSPERDREWNIRPPSLRRAESKGSRR